MSDPRRPHGNYVLEQEDMSVFLHNLLECSSAAAGVATGGTSSVLDYRGSGSSLNFSDPACFFGNEATGRVDKAFSSALSGDCDAVTSSAKRDDFTSSNKLQQATSNRAQPNNSKRSRSAEVHNISEKRRRSKINERLKALQNLIPNSNKTDKASMLEEAIEYLKQLQLQVQMLTIRNGLSLHPSYAPGCSMSAMQLPIDFDAGNVLPNTNRATDTLSGNQQVVMQTVFGNHSLKIPGHQLSAPSSRTTNNNFGTSFGAESSSLPNHHFGLLNHLSSSKDQCREETLPHLPLDVSCSGNNNSSSGVSS